MENTNLSGLIGQSRVQLSQSGQRGQGTKNTSVLGVAIATGGQEVSRKDKKRMQFEAKVSKIKTSFEKDRDRHYRDRLTLLQNDLTTLHQGNNREFLRSLRDLEEIRDLELVQLRLFEEYRVHRSGLEFQEDIEKTKQDHEKMIKLCKEMLYDSLQKKIKKLQEERLLMDVANSHSYSMDYSRGKYQKQTRSSTHNSTTLSNWDSSPNDLSQTESGNETGNATDRRSLRRRAATNQNKEQTPTANGDLSGSVPYGRSSTNSSETELMQYLSDSSELQTLLFGEKEKEKKKGRGYQRLSTKSAPVLQSLSTEEVTDDISLIRRLTNQPPAPFK